MNKKFNRACYIKKWRALTKDRVVASLGGKCCVCGYKKYVGSMHAHHLEPNSKEISITQWIANPKSWERIARELRKCVLLCANCHGEVHAGVSVVPIDAPRFDEKYANYKSIGKTDRCPICHGEKNFFRMTCSRKCAAILGNKKHFDWASVDLGSMISGMSYGEIGDKLGLSSAAVWKRAKKLRLI